MSRVSETTTCVYCKFGLETGGQRRPPRNDGTYIEDIEDPDEIQPPGYNSFLVVLRIEMSRNHVPLSLLDDLPLHLLHGPGVGSKPSVITHSKCYALATQLTFLVG